MGIYIIISKKVRLVMILVFNILERMSGWLNPVEL